MAWVKSIQGILYDKSMHGLGVAQWLNWDPGVACNDIWVNQERYLAQTFLKAKKFLAGRTIMSLLNKFLLEETYHFSILELTHFWGTNLGKVGQILKLVDCGGHPSRNMHLLGENFIL